MSSPTCPYCGKDMEWARSYHSMLLPGQSVRFWWACECGASSPHRAEEDEALAAAMQRWQEPLKPLALREVAGSEEPCVYMEIKGNETIRACDCVISGDLQCIEVSLIGSAMSSWMPINLYGKKWRCWSRRPTDEERESAPWEESQ